MSTNTKNKKQRGASVQRSGVMLTPFKLRYLFVFAAIGVITVLGWGVSLGVGVVLSKPVMRVAVTGEFRFVDRQSITEQVQPLLTDGFVKLDLQAVRNELKSRPWIYDVSVARVWPDEISINVIEQKPIARWAEKGFLNHRGELFQPKQKVTIQDLPLLKGPDGSTGKVMTHFQQLGEVLHQQGLVLRELGLDERGNWIATLDNQVSIVLGSTQIMEKMTRFVTTWKAVLSEQFEHVQRIDMRYSNGLAVSWRSTRLGQG